MMYCWSDRDQPVRQILEELRGEGLPVAYLDFWKAWPVCFISYITHNHLYKSKAKEVVFKNTNYINCECCDDELKDFGCSKIILILIIRYNWRYFLCLQHSQHSTKNSHIYISLQSQYWDIILAALELILTVLVCELKKGSFS